MPIDSFAMRVPFNRPSLGGQEFPYIKDAIRRQHLSGDGYYTRQCSLFLERLTGTSRVLLTPSGTHALELGFMLMDVKPGDEVLLPSFTFPSTANAFVLRGGRPRFVDIRPDTLNVDEETLEAHYSKRTRAIVPVHYAGVPCAMDGIVRFARQHDLTLIEDAAQALGASYRGRPAGSWGAFNAFSFHETKNFGCGEGGALAIRTAAHVRRAEIVRQKGTNREQFLRGEVDKYSWVDVGSSYVPSELQAAYLFAQLQKFAAIQRKRQRLYETYERALRPYAKKGRLRLPTIPADCKSSYHLFYVLLENERDRNRVLDGLQRKRIHAIFHYVPLHLSTMGRRFGYKRGQFPVSERVSGQLLRLPLYNSMTSAEQRYVIQALRTLL